MNAPTPLTINGRKVYDVAQTDAYIEHLMLQIGRLRRKLDDAYSRSDGEER